jgi:4-alpha-glucanotransferase
MQEYRLPGMRVLQFGLAGLDEDSLPHNYVESCIAYTGTHDNDTSRGWFEKSSPTERQFALGYLGADEASVVHQMIASIWASDAMCAVAPIQDVLDLGTEARMNYPGTAVGNWSWRLVPGALSNEAAAWLGGLCRDCRRLPPPRAAS